MLTKEQILSADDIVKEIVHVPEWGGDVMVTTISGAQRDRYEQEMAGIGKGKVVENFRARLLAKCIVGEDGKPMFDHDEVVLLGKKSCKALDRVFEACQRLNGFSDKDVEELEKNSEASQGDCSTSG